MSPEFHIGQGWRLGMRGGSPLILSAQVILAVILLAGCRDDKITARAEEMPVAKPVQVSLVEPADSHQIRSYPGQVRNAVKGVLSFRVAGQILDVGVDSGEAFEKGDILAQIDPRPYELALQLRSVELEEARLRLADARKTFDRTRALNAGNHASDAALDTARREFDAAMMQRNALEVRVEIARDDLRHTKLVASYDGIVRARHIEPEENIETAEPALEIVSASGGLEVQTLIPETMAIDLRPGSRHLVTFPARPGRRFESIVKTTRNKALASGVVPVTLRLDGDANGLRDGMSAEVHFRLDRAHGVAEPVRRIAVPVDAFVPDQGNKGHVFLLDQSLDRLRRSTVSLVSIDRDRAILSGGIDIGSLVVSSGATFVTDGQAVAPIGYGTARFGP